MSTARPRRRFFAADMAAGLYRASAYYLAHALAGPAHARLVGVAAPHMRSTGVGPCLAPAGSRTALALGQRTPCLAPPGP